MLVAGDTNTMGRTTRGERETDSWNNSYPDSWGGGARKRDAWNPIVSLFVLFPFWEGLHHLPIVAKEMLPELGDSPST